MTRLPGEETGGGGGGPEAAGRSGPGATSAPRERRGSRLRASPPMTGAGRRASGAAALAGELAASHGGSTAAAQRVTQLVAAFRGYRRTVTGLRVEVTGRVTDQEELVHPVAGFQVRLEQAGSAAGVALFVSANYAELTRWRGPGREPGGALRERFSVDLHDGFRWGDTEFPTADALAHDLIGYLQFNLDTVA